MKLALLLLFVCLAVRLSAQTFYQDLSQAEAQRQIIAWNDQRLEHYALYDQFGDIYLSVLYHDPASVLKHTMILVHLAKGQKTQSTVLRA